VFSKNGFRSSVCIVWCTAAFIIIADLSLISSFYEKSQKIVRSAATKLAVAIKKNLIQSIDVPVL
jgi:hypothetical protein